MHTSFLLLKNTMQSLWIPEGKTDRVCIIDQRYLPHHVVTEDLRTAEDCYTAIRDMHVRGAPLIGVTAGFGVYLALLSGEKAHYDKRAEEAVRKLESTRPTAVNLFHALNFVLKAVLKEESVENKLKAAFHAACLLMENEISACRAIGKSGLPVIEAISRNKKGQVVNILTHCNAGWLACIQYGTALAPVYLAHKEGIAVHVWVDETRPLNQGSRLTAWELQQEGVPHTVITDNAGGYLMQKRMVDLVIVGSDRVCLSGDIANKTGTYEKALAAFDNHVPFYVAFPSSTIDPKVESGKEIPIEERDQDEIHFLSGSDKGEWQRVRITPNNGRAFNPAFDITPARLITGFITEKGICRPRRNDILRLFPKIV